MALPATIILAPAAAARSTVDGADKKKIVKEKQM
jgi:hypothetical protein